MTTLAQRSFAAGEISPALAARSDQVRYATGLKTCRNNIVMRGGGTLSRPGTELTAEVKDSTKTVRLLPFRFNDAQTYVLEFGEYYMRVHRLGAQLSDLTLTITGVSNANPGVVTYTGTDPVNGEEVYVSGIVGAIGNYLNGRSFKIANVDAGANTFELQYMTGVNVNTTSFGAYGSGGSAARAYTIVTPYTAAHLPDIRFSQSADVITLTHASYAPRELTRTGHTAWTLALVSFLPGISGPTALTGVAGAAGANTYRYRVTAVAEDDSEESLPGTQAGVSIIAITQANPPQLTTVAPHGFATGDHVLITGVNGDYRMGELNNRIYTVTVVGPADFTLDGINTTGFGGIVNPVGTVSRIDVVIAAAAAPTAGAPHVLAWTLVAGAREYNVYKESNGIYGFIAVAGSNGYSDVGLTPDTSDTPPIPSFVLSAVNDYPTAVTFAQQSRIFANSNNEPEKVWKSKAGAFRNFTKSSPQQDDDAVTFTVAGQQANAIQHLVEATRLLLFTSGAECSVAGDSDGVIRPTAINLRQHTAHGSGRVAPLVVGTNVVFVQARGSVLRDFRIDEIEGAKTSDLTTFAAHLLEGYTIVDMAYQQVPHSILWMVRSDGKLLGLTYLREQEILGWHWHDFDGTVENVCCVPEGNEDAVYLVIKRSIHDPVSNVATTKRYIERMTPRRIEDQEDMILMDCALTYDGRNTNAAHTMRLHPRPAVPTGQQWADGNYFELESSAAYFTADDVGNEIVMYEADGRPLRLRIMEYTSTTYVNVLPNRPIPTALRYSLESNWAKAIDEVGGLWHLNGKEVSVLADGNVLASPNNPAYAVLEWGYSAQNGSTGIITLPAPAVRIQVGLPFIADLELLDIDTPQGESLVAKSKQVRAVGLWLEDTRGVFVGGKPPEDNIRNTDEEATFGLNELKVRDSEGYDELTRLFTGTFVVAIQPEWNSNGRIFIRQVDPLPMSVLAAAPIGSLGLGR